MQIIEDSRVKEKLYVEKLPNGLTVMIIPKKGIISTIKSIDDEQDTEITYFFGQELTDNKISLDEYINKIEKITKEDIVKIANSITINTIYFLKNIETAKEDK